MWRPRHHAQSPMKYGRAVDLLVGKGTGQRDGRSDSITLPGATARRPGGGEWPVRAVFLKLTVSGAGQRPFEFAHRGLHENLSPDLDRRTG